MPNDKTTVFLDDLHPSQTIGATMLEEIFDEEEISAKATTKSAGKSTIALGVSQLRKINQEHERFSYDAELGEGAYGKVWKAKDVDIGRPVAIKSYKFGGNVGHKLLSMETDITGKIDHPGVPVLYDIKKTDDEQYHYIMKFIEGESLESIIERLRTGDEETTRQYTFEKRADIIIQILRVLASAHAKGIIHRDIKAENIMIGRAGEAYLMDWGIAIDLKNNTGEGQLAGSPRYMSPEQAAKKALDKRSDLFSLSAVFFELMSLQTHGPKLDDTKEILAVLPEYEPSSSDLNRFHKIQGAYPLQYKPIIQKGLRNDPNARFQSAEEMLVEIESGVSGDIAVSCPISGMLKAFYLVEQSLVKYPIITSLTVMAIFIGAIGSLIYFGTTL